MGAVPTANICTVTWLFGPVLCVKLSFFFVKQEYGVYVLYALSLDCFGIKLTEIGRYDPSSYLTAARRQIFALCRGSSDQFYVLSLAFSL